MNQKNHEEIPENKSKDILDDVIRMIREQTKDGSPIVSIANPPRIKEMADTYRSVYETIGGNDVTISYEMCDTFCTAGSITVKGKEVFFKNPHVLSAAIECSDNMSVYTQTDGYVVMDFMFHGITTRI